MPCGPPEPERMHVALSTMPGQEETREGMAGQPQAGSQQSVAAVPVQSEPFFLGSSSSELPWSSALVPNTIPKLLTAKLGGEPGQ